MLDISDIYTKIYAILEVVHDPLFLIAHYHEEVSNAICSQRQDDMFHERPVTHGQHDLGSGLGKRPAPAAFSCRQYDSLQIYHSQDNLNEYMEHELALYLFGQGFIKNMKGAYPKPV